MRDSIRGVSPVVGIVLLIGIVSIASVSLLLVGGPITDDVKQQSEQQRVQQSFVELSNTVSSATSATETRKSATLEVGKRGAIAQKKTGQYTIFIQNKSGSKTIESGTFGTIEYTGDAGSTFAYEAGAVFHETGAETRVVSEPQFYYDRNPYTLSLPVTTITEEKELSSGELLIDHEKTTPSSVNQVRNDRVYIQIESNYCRGWERYFTDQISPNAIDEACTEGPAKTVTVRLGYTEIENAFSDGVTLPNGQDSITTDNENHNPFDNVAEDNYLPLDGVITNLVDDAEGTDDEFKNIDGNPVTESKSFDDGKYYSEGLGDGGHLTFDLSDGDALLVVNGSITTQTNNDGISVSHCGDGNQLRVYVTGDLNFDNGGTITQECDSNGNVSTVQVYGTSDTTVLFGPGNPVFNGLLYVASDGETPSGGQIDFQGSPRFDGAIIAESINIDSNLNKVNADAPDNPNVEVIPSGYEPAPQVTYLNVANHEVDIKNK